MLLVAKPMLFGPAAIMVTDCGVFGAFGWLAMAEDFPSNKITVCIYFMAGGSSCAEFYF